MDTALQTHHMDSTLKRCGNGRFHVVSTWNPRGVIVRWILYKLENSDDKVMIVTDSLNRKMIKPNDLVFLTYLDNLYIKTLSRFDHFSTLCMKGLISLLLRIRYVKKPW